MQSSISREREREREIVSHGECWSVICDLAPPSVLTGQPQDKEFHLRLEDNHHTPHTSTNAADTHTQNKPIISESKNENLQQFQCIRNTLHNALIPLLYLLLPSTQHTTALHM